MSELKTRPTTASVAEFLAPLDDARRADCEAVLRMMEAATGERAEMWGASIVGFGRYAYTNSTKKTFEWQTHSMFHLPRYSWHQLSNARGDKPARLLHYNYLPMAMEEIAGGKITTPAPPV